MGIAVTEDVREYYNRFVSGRGGVRVMSADTRAQLLGERRTGSRYNNNNNNNNRNNNVKDASRHSNGVYMCVIIRIYFVIIHYYYYYYYYYIIIVIIIIIIMNYLFCIYCICSAHKTIWWI